MNNLNVYTDPLRSARVRVLQTLAESNIDVSNFIVQPKEIRLENVITTRTNYKFSLYETQGSDTQTSTEIKLNRNNAFFATHIALNVAKEVTGVSAVPLANTRLFSYPAANTFAGGAGAEAAALEAFYNALMTFKTVPEERIQELSTQVFRFEPASRLSGVDGDQWGPGFEKQGFMRLSGEIIITGNQDNSIEITLATDADVDAAAAVNLSDEQNILIARLWGFEVINGAQPVYQFLK